MNKCPICDDTLKSLGYDRDDYEEECKNNCYHFIFSYGYTEIIIFNKFFSYYYTYSRDRINMIKDEINEEIKSWKKDERYLMKILSGE